MIDKKSNITIADLFCGAGGTSTGAIEAIESLGYRPRLTAINHWEVAVDTHSANHPEARHLCTSIDDINPRTLYKEGELDILWASPECIFHSNARGGKPINDQSRATAWCVARWAEALRPKIILVENVPEFRNWGPLGANNRPLKNRKGEIFQAWLNALRAIGYTIGHRILRAADYGDPTTRQRLFIQAVHGKLKVVWPEPTHAPADETTDLFGTRKPWAPIRQHINFSTPSSSIFTRKKPLSKKTMQRIWAGLEKFGLAPFIIPKQTGPNRVRSIERPLQTITCEDRGIGLVEPFIIKLRGTTPAQIKKSARSLSAPLDTIAANGNHHALLQPYIIQTTHAGDRNPISINGPIPTVAGNRGDMALIEPMLLPQQSCGVMRPVSQPAPTISTAGAIGLIEPFIIKYYGNGKNICSVDEPLDTITTKDRFALIYPKVNIHGKIHLLDIHHRMLQPPELAAAQGFRKDYIFTGNKTQQIKQIGNAVPRHLARAIVLAALSQKPVIEQYTLAA